MTVILLDPAMGRDLGQSPLSDWACITLHVFGALSRFWNALMRSAKRSNVGPLDRLPYDLLLRVNRQLENEKIELIEEVRQLRAAVNIYREVSNRTDRARSA
jgi:hypothetical protein